MNDDYYRKHINSKYTLHDLLKGKDLEIIAASLLLLGKLKVDSVQLYRNSPTIGVTLIGQYRSIEEDKTNQMADFLDKNGDMTLDEVFDALSKRMNKKRK
ncbi:hypothetical protein [Paenisporosarcina sp.]|jgi:CRISPR/Cas system-associated protein Csx1|uniref:hypothetical protein n=1 Tax=Paenisporosarcina sp. TaxID=1932001 RepID=UPI003C748973